MACVETILNFIFNVFPFQVKKYDSRGKNGIGFLVAEKWKPCLGFHFSATKNPMTDHSDLFLFWIASKQIFF